MARSENPSGNSPQNAAADFDERFRREFTRLLAMRRDVRHFRAGQVDPSLVRRLLESAMLAPSVGYSQPWRWVLVDDRNRRESVLANHVEAKKNGGLGYSGDRSARYDELKLAGLREAPVHIAVFVEIDTPAGHGLGRQTMPETVIWSAMMAIHTMWLAAAAEGLGLGWVSILDPSAVASALDVPKEWTFLAYLCLGWPERYLDRPLLESEQWERRIDFDSVVLAR